MNPPLLWYRLFGAPYKKYGLNKTQIYTVEHIKEVCNKARNVSENAIIRDIRAIIYENENRKWKLCNTSALVVDVVKTEKHLGIYNMEDITFDEYVKILQNIKLYPDIYGYKRRQLNFWFRIIEHINYTMLQIAHKIFHAALYKTLGDLEDAAHDRALLQARHSL